MKKLNLNELKNVNGRWFWEKLPYPEEEYAKMNIGYIHRFFGRDICVTELKGGKIATISLSDANALVKYHNMGIVKPANCN